MIKIFDIADPDPAKVKDRVVVLSNKNPMLSENEDDSSEVESEEDDHEEVKKQDSMPLDIRT